MDSRGQSLGRAAFDYVLAYATKRCATQIGISAPEIANEACVKLIRWAHGSARAGLSDELIEVTVDNLIKDRKRARRSRARHFHPKSVDLLADVICSSRPGPEEVVEEADFRKRRYDLITRIDLKERQAAMLRLFGLSADQIAEFNDESKSAVTSRWDRTADKLKKLERVTQPRSRGT